MSRPVLLIHGYSAQGDSFEKWKNELTDRGFQAQSLRICDYETLTNEVSIKDIAEAMNRAIAATLEPDVEFDAIVHSTGMLVVRSWLTTYGWDAEKRRGRLKGLVALAPATFGSPLAHKGRSWLGSIFKGRKMPGPDFLEAGDLILDGLELGSRFTWNLAHRDLFSGAVFYGAGPGTPNVYIFCGTGQYSGIYAVANGPGTDGTVRWAGCPLNSRKINLNMTQQQGNSTAARFTIGPFVNDDIEVCLVPNVHHGRILSHPPAELVDMVAEALQVSTEEEDVNIRQKMSQISAPVRAELKQRKAEWQQFVVMCRDERGDPITDYNLQLVLIAANGGFRNIDMDVHTYSADASLRCFHVNISKVNAMLEDSGGGCTLHLRLLASTGTRLIDYVGYGASPGVHKASMPGPCTASLDVTPWLGREEFKLFMPFTTTLIEIFLDREPTVPAGQVMPTVFRVGS